MSQYIQQFIPSFAHRIMRPLKSVQKDLILQSLPKFQIGPDSDFIKLFQGYDKIAIEIGFGDGKYLLTQAQSNPHTLYIGCEPYLNGAVKVLSAIEHKHIDNIKLYIDDARILLSSLPDETLDETYIICPDPWPKKRHFKRRLITTQFLQNLSCKITANGYVLIVTDHYDYAHWIHEAILQSNIFCNIYENIEKYIGVPENWIYTKYQKAGLAQGSDIYFFKCYLR